MAEFPALPLWTDAYLGDTTHLTTIEHGAYLLMIIHYWKSGGGIPDDRMCFQRITKCDNRNCTLLYERVRKFFYSENGVLKHKRIDEELSNSLKNKDKQTKRTAAATEAARAARLSKNPSVTDSVTDSVTFNVTSSPSPSLKKENTPPLAIPEWVPQPDFDEWVKQRKKKLTGYALKLNLATLEKLKNEGHNPLDVLRIKPHRHDTALGIALGKLGAPNLRFSLLCHVP